MMEESFSLINCRSGGGHVSWPAIPFDEQVSQFRRELSFPFEEWFLLID